MTRIAAPTAIPTALIASLIVGGPVLGQNWVDFADETATRMPTDLNDPATSTSDDEEKDYAWGDVDNDGDTDLVVVRKQPFTSTGKRVNVLFMLEGTAEGHAMDGIFVDRTDEYATASDVDGDEVQDLVEHIRVPRGSGGATHS